MTLKAKPIILTWTSSKTSPKNAAKELQKETTRQAAFGYALMSTTWASSGRGCLSTIVKAVIFLPLVLTGGGKGQLTAVFQRMDETP